jgi:FMN phosphatase YigB (HAD superfamily)
MARGSKSLFTIAFDLGGVVFAANDDDTFWTRHLETALTPGIFDLLRFLAKQEQLKLIVISKAFPTNARKSREILRLYELDACFNSIIFCEENRAKAEIARAMRVDVMIDDKQEEVLDHFDASIRTIRFEPHRVDELYRLAPP